MTPAVKLMTPQQVAEVLNVSPMTVYRLVHAEALRAHRVGRSFRIDPRDFADYMRHNVTDGGES